MEAGLSHLDGPKKQELALPVNNEFPVFYGSLTVTRRKTFWADRLPLSGMEER